MSRQLFIQEHSIPGPLKKSNLLFYCTKLCFVVSQFQKWCSRIAVFQNAVPKNTSLIKTSRKETVRWKKITFLFIALVLLCGWGVNAFVSGDSVQYDVVTVEENDTLWDIAARRVDNTKGYQTKVIYDIEQFNHITIPASWNQGWKSRFLWIYKSISLLKSKRLFFWRKSSSKE